MRQASNIHYFVGLTAISLLVSSCSVDKNATKITAPQKLANSQPSKADLISALLYVK